MSRALLDFPEAAPFEQILRQRLRWMVRLRWLVGIGILATIFFARRITAVEYAEIPLLFIVGFIFIYNLVVDNLCNRLGPKPDTRSLFFIANLQIGLDIVALFMLVAATGGVQNLFVFYAVFHVALGSILLPRRNMIIITAVICLGAVLLFLADYHGFLPASWRMKGFLPETLHRNRTYVFGLSYIFITLVAVTAYITISISENLRRAEKRLIMLTREIESERSACANQNLELVALEAKKSDLFRMFAARLQGPAHEIELAVLSAMEKEGSEVLALELARLRDSSEVLADLIGDLLEAERLQKAEHSSLSAPVDLAAVARKVVRDLIGPARERGIELHAEVGEDLPSIQGDPEGWPRAIENLLKNAIRNARPGTIIDFGLHRDWQGQTIGAYIRDSGPAVSSFEAALKASGEGIEIAENGAMGILLARKTVEMQGGKIEVVEESPGVRSLVISIPVRPEKDAIRRREGV